MFEKKKRRPYRGRRAQERRRRSNVLRVFVSVFLITFVGTGIWYGTRLEVVTIDTVSVSGGETVSHERIEKKVQQEIEGTYAVLIPKRFSYTYPRHVIEKTVQDVPRIKGVSVSRISRKEIAVTFTEYTPYALWCAEHLAETSSCVFISKEGYAFSTAPLLKGSFFLRHVKEGVNPEVGMYIGSATYVRGSEELREVLREEQNFNMSEIFITTEGDVRYQLRGGGEIVTSDTAQVQEVYENLSSLLTSEQFVHIEEGNFSYIDMRFGNEIFVNENLGEDISMVEEEREVGEISEEVIEEIE